jgi:hypothetical protein
MPSCSGMALVRNAVAVGAVRHLEVGVGHVVVADEAQAVGPNGHGGELNDIACVVQGGEGGGGAGLVGA